jgi:FtsP/CotA-like multicopper oxidase with cupredoxin domain
VVRQFFAYPTVILLLLASPDLASPSERTSDEGTPEIVINDNRRPAGERQGQCLELKLRAGVGVWRPEGNDGPAIEVAAFGEPSRPLEIPAPLIRVPEGTEIIASIRNDLEHTLTVNGMCPRDGSPCAPIEIAAASERTVRFRSGRAGTYHYSATTTRVPMPFRDSADSQLSGAFIVDPPDLPATPDRVLVITEWTSLSRRQFLEIASAVDPTAAFVAAQPQFTFLINGLSWPATERLGYQVDDDVRWRVVNLSTQQHPMHLHGFYFTVDSLGDGVRDTTFQPDRKRRVVTQLLAPNATMAMTWRPERAGNWLFHCHISDHVSPERRLGEHAPGHHDDAHHRGAGMAGMILGVSVRAKDDSSTSDVAAAARKLTLTMQRGPEQTGAHPVYGFALSGDGETLPSSTVTVPGPTLVLRRGQPVEITLENRLPESTAIHWHGIELDSYYDGVHGWSGTGNRVTPLIEPEQRFVVRFTPPRAGTFIYHTHLHDHQLASGMYGALVVLESGDTFDPDFDHVVVIAQDGPGSDAPTTLNGSRQQQFVWKAGARHRLRFINITPGDVFVTSLAKTDGPVEWRPLSKDGERVPAADRTQGEATQTMAVGETFDFEYDAPPARHSLWINVRTPAGRWAVQGRVAIR